MSLIDPLDVFVAILGFLSFIVWVRLAMFPFSLPKQHGTHLIRRKLNKKGRTMAGHVVRVIDGDTIKVRLTSGKIERVRYIGCDAPEMYTQAGRDAKLYNDCLVGDQDVILSTDVKERDFWGRLLCYVTVGTKFVNRSLVRDGFARPLRVYPNVTRASEIEQR